MNIKKMKDDNRKTTEHRLTKNCLNNIFNYISNGSKYPQNKGNYQQLQNKSKNFSPWY